jgi:hypothetical protein
MHYNDSNSAVARASRIRHAHDMEATHLDSMHRRSVPERPNVLSRAITRLRRQRTPSLPSPMTVPVPVRSKARTRDL